MILKIAGSLLILCSTTLGGYAAAVQYKYRAEELAMMARAVSLLKSQIYYMSTPLPEAMKEIAVKIGGVIGSMFAMASQRMERREGEGAEDIWKQALLEHKKKLYLSNEDYDALFTFGKTLGYLDREQQQSSIEMLLNYLKDTEQLLKEKSKVNYKLYCSMGVIMGLLLVVVLV